MFYNVDFYTQLAQLLSKIKKMDYQMGTCKAIQSKIDIQVKRLPVGIDERNQAKIVYVKQNQNILSEHTRRTK